MNTFGEYLRKVRKAKGISQRKVASAIGVDFSYICKIEQNLNSPSDEVIQRISNVLGVEVEEMMRHAGRLTPDLKTMIFGNPEMFDIIRIVEANNLSCSQIQSICKKN